MKELKNRLELESSPYLRQHALNPVHWQPWGNEAFQFAKENNRPVFLSIGYSTCHWCHVMEHESFENTEVAAFLNQEFVSIKVDREERPDVDDVYMTAVQQLTGQGGWPLSVFLFPDASPFFGGTYFPQKHFLELLKKIKSAWIHHTLDLKSNAKILSESIQKEWSANPINPETQTLNVKLKYFEENMKNRFDSHYGGFSDAPKFPQSMILQALFRAIHFNSADADLTPMVHKTLFEMSHRGLMDHLEGGFHRYSTDEEWLVPHFEKMLYDNALLALAYCEAFQLTQNPMWEHVTRETLEYVMNFLTSPEGGFYAAEDADSLTSSGKKEEGYFYSWDFNELAQEKALSKVFHFTEAGNFEGRNILTFQKEKTVLDKNAPDIQAALHTLKEQRKKRAAPHRDEKIITSWNAIMIAAFAKAYLVFEDVRYLEHAQKAYAFIKNKNMDENKQEIRHSSCKGVVQQEGFSEDYASLSFALIHLYEATGEAHLIHEALRIFEKQNEKFLDSKQGGYFRNESEDPLLPFRPKESYEGVFPTAHSLTAWNLVRFSKYFLEQKYMDHAQSLMTQFICSDKNAPMRFPMMVAVAYEVVHGMKEMVQVTSRAPLELKSFEFFKKFHPDIVFAWGHEPQTLSLTQGKKLLEGSQKTFYLCVQGACLKPEKELKI